MILRKGSTRIEKTCLHLKNEPRLILHLPLQMLLCSRYITKSSFPYKLFNNLEIIYCSTSDTQLKSENGDIITKAKTNPDGGVQSVLIPKLGLIKAFPKQIGGALI